MKFPRMAYHRRRCNFESKWIIYVHLPVGAQWSLSRPVCWTCKTAARISQWEILTDNASDSLPPTVAKVEAQWIKWNLQEIGPESLWEDLISLEKVSKESGISLLKTFLENLLGGSFERNHLNRLNCFDSNEEFSLKTNPITEEIIISIL